MSLSLEQKVLHWTVAACVLLTPLAGNALPQRPPESNAQALLLQALPQKDTESIQELGSTLSKVTTEGSGNIRSVEAKGSKGIRGWDVVIKAQRAADSVLGLREADILGAVGDNNQAKAKTLLAGIKSDIAAVGKAAGDQNRAEVVNAQIAALEKVDALGVMMLKKAPFVTPSDEAPEIPRTYGRAYADITVQAAKTGKTSVIHAILDGVNAPLTVGNFVELAKSGAYDNMPVSFTDESTVMTGVQKGKSGYEPKGSLRLLPLELRAEGDKEISYEETFEEQGRFTAKPVLPFSAYGTLAMMHPPDNSNGASSKFFLLKYDPIYTPAGLNTLDGNYAVFGYATSGTGVLDDLAANDVVKSVKIVDILELSP